MWDLCSFHVYSRFFSERASDVMMSSLSREGTSGRFPYIRSYFLPPTGCEVFYNALLMISCRYRLYCIFRARCCTSNSALHRELPPKNDSQQHINILAQWHFSSADRHTPEPWHTCYFIIGNRDNLHKAKWPARKPCFSKKLKNTFYYLRQMLGLKRKKKSKLKTAFLGVT